MGPKFWCQDIVKAKKCGAVKFCISAVWTTHFSVIDSDSICDDCKAWVNKARDLIKSKTTLNILIGSLESVCGIIPLKPLEKACEKTVDENFPEIMKMLESTMDANAICSTCFFCNNAEYDKALETAVAKKPSIGVHQVTVDSAVQLSRKPVAEKPSCQFCVFAVQSVKDLIRSNKTKESIESALGKLCSQLKPDLMGQCTEFVKDYTNQVVDMLLADFSAQDACTFIKLCTDKSPELMNVKIVSVSAGIDESKHNILDNPQCDLCKDVVRVVEQNIINDNTKEEIRSILEKSCSRLKKFAAKCKAFVDEFSDRIFDLVQKELEPEEICTELLFCVTVDNADSQDYDSGLEIFDLAMKEPVEEIKEQPQCVICEFVMTKFEEEINDTKTDEEIKNSLRHICSKMPNTVAKSCNQFINFYFDMVIALLKTMTPPMVCSELKLCSGVDAIADEKDMKMVEAIRNDVYTCAICKGFVTSADTIINDDKIDQKIEDLEENFCEKVSGKYKEKCQKLTQTYGEAIVKLLQTITESDQICYKLNLCAMESDTGMVKLTED